MGFKKGGTDKEKGIDKGEILKFQKSDKIQPASMYQPEEDN